MKSVSSSASVAVRRAIPLLTLCCLVLFCAPCLAGTVSGAYTDLPLGTNINLTQPGYVDWVKWGLSGQSGAGWTADRKSAAPTIISSALTPIGASITLVAFTGGNVLNFNWTDGIAPVAGSSDTVVTETNFQSSYPLGIGAAMTASADAQTRILDVYVQGFDATMHILASMSGGGSTSTDVLPTKHPATDAANFYASGVYRVAFSGAGETLTVSVTTQAPVQPGAQQQFSNAGFFAAAIVPEPGSIALVSAAGLVFALIPMRRRLQERVPR